MGHVNAIDYNIWRMQTARASYASVFVVCRTRSWHNQLRRQSIFPNKRRYGQSVVYVWTKTLKITKLDGRFALRKKHGFTVKITYETYSEWEIIYHWAQHTYGDFIVLPPSRRKPPDYNDERQWGLTLGEHYDIYLKDETAPTMLLLMVDSKR